MQIKLLEKSTTPANVRVLADRFAQQQNGQMLVGIKGKRLAISCGQTEEVAFVVPRRTGKEGPGVILQEFELIVEPACRVIFEKSVDQANQT